jgi:hypothetical protein
MFYLLCKSVWQNNSHPQGKISTLLFKMIGCILVTSEIFKIFMIRTYCKSHKEILESL